MNAGEIGAWRGQPTRLAAERQRQMRIGQRPAAFERDATSREIERRRARVEQEVDGMIGVETRAAQELRLSGRIFQERFGERRAMIGRNAFVADKRDTALIAFFAQARRDLRAAVARADDDRMLHLSGHVRPRSLSALRMPGSAARLDHSSPISLKASRATRKLSMAAGTPQ